MSGVLRDLGYQVLSLAAVLGGTLGVLLVVHGVLVAGRELRAWWRERRAVRRVSRQAALGRDDKLTGCAIEWRRR